MNCLRGVTLKRASGQDLHCAVTYDALGRMTSRQAVTAVNGTPQVTSVFSQPVFHSTKVHALSTAQTTESLFPTSSQSIAYTGFDKVSKIKQSNDSLCYTYGYDRQRIRMEECMGNTIHAKDYVGMCEYVTEADLGGTVSKSRTYLTGPYGVFAVVEKRNGEETLHYILKDNLGSWTTVTNSVGTVEQQLSYDAWGSRRNPDTWANYTSDDTYAQTMFDRGYTGHEHLSSFGLINMNGRMYDPVVSSFLSADRYVQNPMSAQGFNRYAYCMYNPLRFVDPTGWLSGGGGGYGEHPPGMPYYVNGMLTVNLPEVTIRPQDNPSLSNTYKEYVYTPYCCGGGSDLQWSNVNNSSFIGHDGCGGGGGDHFGKANNTIGNIPPQGVVVHNGNMLFLKTFLRYQIGALNNIGLISEDYWVDASTININEIDLIYRPEKNDYVVNLFNNGDLMQGLALGHLVLNKVGEYEYTIQPDEYDFRIESYRSFGGNAATIFGWGVHYFGMPFFLPKGTYTIRFYGTVTTKH
jgi:RHS repeat-associated protein